MDSSTTIYALGWILLLVGVILAASDSTKGSRWRQLLGLQGFVIGVALLIIAKSTASKSFLIGMFLLSEFIVCLISAYMLRDSKFRKRSIVQRTFYSASILCATALYVVIFTFPNAEGEEIHPLLFFTGLAVLGIAILGGEGFAKRRGFIKSLLISLVVCLGVASIMSSIAKTPLRTFVSWVLLLESIFLIFYVIRKTCLKSQKQALIGLISLIACLSLLTTLIVKSPHDPLFNFLPLKKFQKDSQPPVMRPWG